MARVEPERPLGQRKTRPAKKSAIIPMTMYLSPTTQNLSDLDLDLSRSLKVKCNGA